MHELILHHYPQSPFAEKARLLLGFKQLSWRSVLIPPIMPKPDLTALTGGYRKTPVLQVGADIYCDTALIARRLEAEKHTPALFPEGQELAVSAMAAWADSTLFLHAVALAFQPEAIALRMASMPPEMAQAFIKDRQGLFSGGSAQRVPLEQAKQHWPTFMQRLSQQLARGAGDYLLGEPSLADIAIAHPVWFLMQNPVTAPLVSGDETINAWYQRVMAFGHGAFEPLKGDEAVAIAAQASPQALPDTPLWELPGVTLGQTVHVAASDYGVDAVSGELLHADSESLIIRRTDERAGTVHVHFPRINFVVTPAD